MIVTLNYYDRDYNSTYSKIVSQKDINVSDDIDCFEQFYKLNNSLRYCNGSYYKFVDKEWENKYLEWLKSEDYKKKSFNLFYGEGGIVD